MKFDINKYKSIIWAAVAVVALGGGIGIGYAINDSDSDSTSTDYVLNPRIKPLFNVNRVDPPLVNNPSLLSLPSELNVALATDGAGVINDKSFNDATGKGLLDIYGLSDALSDHATLYRVPTDTNATTIIQVYQDLYNSFSDKDDATVRKVIIAPGFGHSAAISKFWEANPTGYDDLYFLLLDQPPTYGNPVANLKNTYSIEFDVSKSGFKAAMLASLYLDAIGDANPMVGTWGGGDFPGVTSFMKGFVSGVIYYNQQVKAAAKPDVKIVKFNTDADYLNSGFELGGGTEKADYLIDKGADVILPVAGAQTKDLIDAIKRSQRKDEVKIVGVDTDQSITYDEDKGLFITSITKNLRKAAYEGYKEITSNSTQIDGTYDPAQDSTGSYTGDDSRNFSSYTKQFVIDQDNVNSAIWKYIYEKVDDLPVVVQSWEHAFAYIKSQ